MQVKYLVQEPHMTDSSARADVNGTPMAVTVKAFEVSLRAMDSQNGGTVLRFVGPDVGPAQELFKNDAIVSATYAATDEKYEPK